MPPARRLSAAQPALNFEHPYLDGKQARRSQKRELGIVDLFVFKMFGCFTADDLPPPNPDATVYQTGKSSSSTLTMSTNTTGTTGQSNVKNPLNKKRDTRTEARASSWPSKVPEPSRVVERTQFVEQRVEEKRREAQRRLEAERLAAAHRAAKESAAMAAEVAESGKTGGKLGKFGVVKRASVGSPVLSDRVRAGEFSLENDVEKGKSGEDKDKVELGANVAGKVSRLSAMFEQQ